MNKILFSEIDAILIECSNKNFFAISLNTKSSIIKAINIATSLNIIKWKSSGSYELDEKGGLIILSGLTLFEYLEKEKFKEQKSEQIQDFTLKNLKFSLFKIKYWWIIVLISGVIGFISGNFELILKLFGITTNTP